LGKYLKAILISAFLAASALNAFGQGFVTFNNRITTATPNPIVSPIYLDFVGGIALDGTDTSFRAALLGGATSSIPAFIPGSRTNSTATGVQAEGTLSLLASPATGATWVMFRTGALSGFIELTTDSTRDSGLGFGATGMFQVVAWRGGFTTWVDAYSAWNSGTNSSVLIGASNPMILPVSVGPAQTDFPTLQGLESFTLKTSIPEPSSFALAVFGVMVWFWIRERRKQLA
jgi:hypothetical protein